MKKLLLFLMASCAFAAGTVNVTLAPLTPTAVPVWVLTYAWTGDASTGSVPATAAAALIQQAQLQGYLIYEGEFIPGATTVPTNGYSVTVTNTASVDVLAGAGSTLSSTTSKVSLISPPQILSGTLTLNVSGQSVASATGQVLIYLVPNPYTGTQVTTALVNVTTNPSGVCVPPQPLNFNNGTGSGAGQLSGCACSGGSCTWATIGGGSGTFTALTGDATSTATGGATTVLKVNGNTPGGTCTSQFVSSVSSSAVPTCTSVTPTLAGLSNVTNDAQTKAAIMPNTAPSAGQVAVGNAGGTAYAPVTISGGCTLASTGVMTCSGSGNMNTSTYDPAAIAQQVVGTTATQTLSNKTLVAPVLGAATATSVSTGTSPPASAWFTGTAGLDGFGTGTCSGTVPAGAGFLCALSTLSGPEWMTSGGSIPVVMGPASATSGHVATFNGTNGSLLQDGGALPTGTVTTVGFTGGLISVGSPTSAPALTVAGTSGGIVGFTSSSAWASSAAWAAGGIGYGLGAGSVPVATAAGTAKQIVLSGGAGAPTMIDFPHVMDIPAANCGPSSTPGAGWSTSISPICRAGTNNKGGVLPFADASTAQFDLEIPGDADLTSGNYPYIKLFFTDGANTSGTEIFQAQVSCYVADFSATDDVAFATAQVFTTRTATAANRSGSENLQFNSTSMSGCVAGASMIVLITRNTDTAASPVNVSKASITFSRLLAVGAQ